MSSNHSQHKETVIAFLKMMEARQSVNELEQFYHPEIEQIEFPNAILKETAFRNLTDLKTGAERGSKIMSKEKYEIKNLHAFNNIVILEAVWTGTLSIPLGKLSAGDNMVAYFAQFFEFKDGKIYRQRNYDCFEPFAQ